MFVLFGGPKFVRMATIWISRCVFVLPARASDGSGTAPAPALGEAEAAIGAAHDGDEPVRAQLLGEVHDVLPVMCSVQATSKLKSGPLRWAS